MGCTKVKFRTEKDANFHIKKKAQTALKPDRKASAYFCPHCHSWHITSHPKGENGVIENYERQIKNLKAKLAARDREIESLKTQIYT